MDAEIDQLAELGRMLFESSADALFLFDSDDEQILAANSTAQRMTGFDCAALTRLSLDILFRANAPDGMQQLRKGYRRTGLFHSHTGFSLRHEKKRVWVPVDLTVTRLHGDAPALAVIAARDVTDHREAQTQFDKTEAELRQPEQMNALGQLAGGMAHDLNDHLTAILGNLTLLCTSTTLNAANRELLQNAEIAALRTASLTSKLIEFAHPTQFQAERIFLNSLVPAVVSLIKPTIDPRITFDVRPDPELWPVLGDAGQLGEVLRHLCVDACNAMPNGGELLIQTENNVLSPETMGNRIVARIGEFVCLRVQDTGAGKSGKVRDLFIDSPLTTKTPGNGMAIFLRIVQQHRGWIECESEPGHGTAFSVFLPRLVTTQPFPSASEIPSGELQGSPEMETILFVDDEPDLRSLGQTILERSGYQVLLAGDGMEALSIFNEKRGRIGLVILDLSMPCLSGQDTFRALQRLDKDVGVLFVSGYSPEQLSAEDRRSSAGFMMKPYRPCELVATVREILECRARKVK